jgi:hypothetical protein
VGSFSSFGTHAVACSCGRETDDMSPSFPSSRVAVRHNSNMPGAFHFTMSFQDARCGTAFPANACPTVQDWGQVCSFQGNNCGGFGAFTRCFATSAATSPPCASKGMPCCLRWLSSPYYLDLLRSYLDMQILPNSLLVLSYV